MARYYFHLYEGERSSPDGEGVELDGLESVRRAALQGARSIISHDAHDGIIDLTSRIEVADAAGRIVLVLPFAEAVQVKLGSSPGGAPPADGRVGGDGCEQSWSGLT